MGSDFLLATLFNLSVNLIYTVVALMVGVLALKFVDKRLLERVDIEEELKNNNIAVAIFASTILLFAAMIVSFGLKA
ncbi:DUF350 domain-containing protein [Alcanivorax sp. 1008]|uniref:DUF350 domain-containing protein n=1 Tax=Alcanivorax sp. 1008 TaxID=2816853 RepID=UPI001D488109|nr:DUF350 domain-containing protein [Alcanivorax sp. 1008]MCC1497022.1 DUF350 domain-containing protein [Alcanivorax sp. 1008]